jgi:hypothetical protein
MGWRDEVRRKEFTDKEVRSYRLAFLGLVPLGVLFSVVGWIGDGNPWAGVAALGPALGAFIMWSPRQRRAVLGLEPVANRPE